MTILGYNTIAGTPNGGLSSDTATGCKFTAVSSGTSTGIFAYTHTTSAPTSNMRFSIYSDVSGSPDTKIWESPSNIAVTTTPSWYTDTVSISIVSGTTYWLFWWIDDTYTIYGDAGGSNQAAVEFGLSYPTWENPFDGTNEAFDSSVLSIYLTYDEPIITANIAWFTA